MSYFYKVSGKVGDAFLRDEINELTLKIYLLMIKRASITKYEDENGKYFLMKREEIGKELKTKCKISITKAIKELEKMDILFIERKSGKASKYYLK